MEANVKTSCAITGPDDFGFEITQSFKKVGQATLTKLFDYMATVIAKKRDTTGDYQIVLGVDMTDSASGATVPLPNGVDPSMTFTSDRAGVEDFEELMLSETQALLGRVKKGKGKGQAKQHGRP